MNDEFLKAILNAYPNAYPKPINVQVNSFYKNATANVNRDNLEFVPIKDAIESLKTMDANGLYVEIAMLNTNGDVISVHTEIISTVDNSDIIGDFFTTKSEHVYNSSMNTYVKIFDTTPTVKDRLAEVEAGNPIKKVITKYGKVFDNCIRTRLGVVYVNKAGYGAELHADHIEDFEL